MKKSLLVLTIIFLMIGCSAPGISQGRLNASSNVASSTLSSTSVENEPVLTGIDLYMKCFNEGKYDIYNLKIGDPIQDAVEEFGPGEKKYYGLGGYCYNYDDVVVIFAEGTESFANRVEIFDIIGEGITAYGITTGQSTVEDVKKILGEPEYTKQYTYDMVKTMEDPYDAGEKYCNLCYYNTNKDLWCFVDFFFEDGVLKVISLGTLTGFYENN